MFLGHQNDIKDNHWNVLPQTNNTTTLLNDNGTYKLQDNICHHQGSRLREGTGAGLNVICPYHAWSWDSKGSPLGSGTVGHSRGSEQCVNVHNLNTKPVYNWSGFLFDEMVPLDDVDISGNYKLMEYRRDIVKSNFVPIMDVFLDIDHIPIVHPNLYAAIDVPSAKDIVWKSWAGGSMQYVPVTEKDNSSWAKLAANKKIPYGALWIAQYPHTQFEWQPGAVFIQVSEPRGVDETVCHIFKYRDYNFNDETWEINETIWETAWLQDCQQAAKLEPGWRLRQDYLEQEKLNYRTFLEGIK